MSQPHALLAEYDTPADIMAAAEKGGSTASPESSLMSLSDTHFFSWDS